MVAEAEDAFAIGHMPDGKCLPDAQLPHTHVFAGHCQPTRLPLVAGWAGDKIDQRWLELARDPATIQRHGADPLERMYNLPSNWPPPAQNVPIGPLPFLEGAIRDLRGTSTYKPTLLEKWSGLEAVVRQRGVG